MALENLLDTSLSFYRDTFEILNGSIPVSASYSITFPYDTFFAITATATTTTTITLTGGSRTEAFNFYADNEMMKQGQIAFTSLTAVTSNLSAAGGTVVIITTNAYGKPLKCKWLLGAYNCRVLNRAHVYPYPPFGETDKADMKVACASTAMAIGDIAIYNDEDYNVNSVTSISGIKGFSHSELLLRRR